MSSTGGMIGVLVAMADRASSSSALTEVCRIIISAERSRWSKLRLSRLFPQLSSQVFQQVTHHAHRSALYFFVTCAAVGGRPELATRGMPTLGFSVTAPPHVFLPGRTTRETWNSFRKRASKSRSACSCCAVLAASFRRVCCAVAPCREHHLISIITDCMLHVARSATLSSPPSRCGDHEMSRSPNLRGCVNSPGRLCTRSNATTAPSAKSISSRVRASRKRARCVSCKSSSASSHSSTLVAREKPERHDS
mmetsp:Transcript_22165/g.67283  ORF Transcript_22165/g.67283 Transcript_22165/m.67283 type:complete len:251 (+) Transcript_22165:602-1354(+)|eukprot:scaffold312370_cov28-Tisochrysis_lutea.AAC.2